MKYVNKCPFCENSRFENNKLVNLPDDGTLLYQDDNLYIQVDISPLTRGHILIISNYHYLNFYEMPDNIKEDVTKIKNCLKRLYKELYGTDVLFFEHGSAQSGYAGASIDHAHLHCIPYISDKVRIKRSLSRSFGKSIKCDILAPSKFHNEFSYLYLESEKDGKCIYKVDKLPSQYLRKLVFNRLGENDYMWQEKCTTNKSIDNLKKTMSDLKGKITISG